MTTQLAKTQTRVLEMQPLPNIDLPTLCREVRKQAGLTLNEIGHLLGTSWRTYARWEAGAEPSGRFMAKLFNLKSMLAEKSVPKSRVSNKVSCPTPPHLSSPSEDYYLGLPLNSAHSTLKTFLATLEDRSTIINQAQLPVVFTEVCQLIFEHIFQSDGNIDLNLSPDYFRAVYQSNLNEIVWSLFPAARYAHHDLVISCATRYLKNFWYRKYLSQAKANLQSLTPHSLWLTQLKCVGLDATRPWLLIAVVGVKEQQSIKPMLVGMQQTSAPQDPHYLIRHLLERGLKQPGLIFHDEEINAQAIKTAFLQTQKYLVSECICDKPSNIKVTKLFSLASSCGNVKQLVNKQKKKAPTCAECGIKGKPAFPHYLKTFAQITSPFILLELTMPRDKDNPYQTSLAMGVWWEMLRLAVDKLPLLPSPAQE